MYFRLLLGGYLLLQPTFHTKAVVLGARCSRRPAPAPAAPGAARQHSPPRLHPLGFQALSLLQTSLSCEK